MAYNIRALQETDQPSLTAFLDTVFHIRNKEKESLVWWKYFHPFVGHRVQFGAFDGDRLIAHYANIPLTIRYNSTVVPAMLCIDMSTHPAYRGLGLISALSEATYAAIAKTSRALSLGFSNSAGVKVDLYAHSYGYRVVGAFTSYALMAQQSKHPPVTLTQTKELGSYEYHVPDGYISINKSREYGTWRYIDHPGSPYTIYAVEKDNVPIGYVIMRISRFRIDIIDIILSNMQEYLVHDVVVSVQHLAFSLHKHLVVLGVLDNDYWKRVLHGTLGMKKPISDAYYLTVRVHNPSITGPDVYDPRRWICMTGDIL